MIKLLSSFPTSVFTGALAFFLTWWVVTTIFSGIDADTDTDADIDVDVDIDADFQHGASQGSGNGSHGHGGHDGHFVSNALAIGYVPLPLALTVLSFGAWSVSLLLQLLLGSDETAKLALIAGLAVMLAALLCGFTLLRVLRSPLAPLFEIENAPERTRAVGATCKVRTLVVTDRLGDAEVLTGPTKGSLIRVRADEGRFTRGDVAVIIDYDAVTEAFVIDDIDEHLRP